MKIAITGANSRIGQTVQKVFYQAGHEVIALVRNPVNKSDMQFDLSIPVSPEQLKSFDLLIHIGWDRSRNYQESLNVNRIGGLNLLNACASAGIVPVLLSTMSVHAPMSEYGKTKRILENRVLELSGRIIRSGLIWGDQLSGFLITVDRIASIPIIKPQLRPDPHLFHSEINALANCIVQISLSKSSPALISAIAKDYVKLSALMSAMGKSRGFAIGVSAQVTHKVSRRLERLGINLPFNSDSISGILGSVTDDEISKSRQEDIEFPDSERFLTWATSC